MPGSTPVARVTVRNTGARAGRDVPQLYLVSTPDGRTQRLAGFAQATLAPGEARQLTLMIEPRILADRRGGAWVIRGGRYGFAIGWSASDLGPVTYVTLRERRWN